MSNDKAHRLLVCLRRRLACLRLWLACLRLWLACLRRWLACLRRWLGRLRRWLACLPRLFAQLPAFDVKKLSLLRTEALQQLIAADQRCLGVRHCASSAFCSFVKIVTVAMRRV